MKIVVLGGAGKMGVLAVQDLVLNPRVDAVVIADLNSDVAQTAAGYLASPKVTVEQVDLGDHQALVRVLAGCDACVNATVYYTNLAVMRACLEAHVHYTDLGGLFHTTRQQLRLHDQFVAEGISAVLGMGSAPGIPNIQARYAADRLDTIDYIHIFDGIKPPDSDQVLFTYAVPTIIDEMTLPPMVFRGGEFVERPPLSEMESYWFAPPIGSLDMHLSLHSEVATLPVSFAAKGIQECFFKINHWGMPVPVVEKVKVLAEFGFAEREPVVANGSQVVPRDLLVAMMGRYVPPITAFLDAPDRQPPHWVKEVVTEVKGVEDGRPVTYRIGTLTARSPLPTGVVPARGAVWQAAGRVPAGVYPPEQAFDPQAFLKELEEREIFTRVTVMQPL